MITYLGFSQNNKSFKPYPKWKAGRIGLVEKATDADIAKVATETDLEVADLMDIYDAQEIPRLEIEKNGVLLFVRAPLPLENAGELETQLYMIVWVKQKLFIVTGGLATQFRMSVNLEKIKHLDISERLVEFLLSISREFTKNINEVAVRVENFRRQGKNLTNKHIEELIDLEVILNEYVSVLAPMDLICTNLFSRRRAVWKQPMVDLLEDLKNSLAQSTDVSLVNLKKIHSLRDSFQILFTNRLNQTVKILTAVTIILTIPTMIASVFGMNVMLPGGNHPWAFGIVIALALGLAGGAAWIFNKNGWM